MIIEPRMRGFICLTAHPEGCAQNVKNQIEYVKSKGKINGPKRVLVVGASTGFGLASRITAAFGKTATPGWYNSAAFEEEATKAGLYAKSINGDAFSKEIKQQTIDMIKSDLGQVDLVIYSLASPVRLHPETGVLYRSSLKPIGQTFSDKTVDFHTGNVSQVSIEPAVQEDIDNTVVVMGGEDWSMWLNDMKKAGVLANGATTVAYSYIGPEVTSAVYRKGTIGQAKDHLEATAFDISKSLEEIGGKAYVSVNKA
jgi:enoyl-[acyl-carrier protein] reductase / trans-2-enoyl-CoA reductase (NAD+)